MRIQTIHRNPMGEVLNECSAHGFRITTENGDVYDISTEGGMVTIQTRGRIVNLEFIPELLQMLDIKKPAAPSAPEYPITATCRVCDCDYRCVPVPAKCGACGSDLPPSAPVGAEGFDEWYDSVDARFWNNWDACNAAFHAGKRAALAAQQQPAAEAQGGGDVNMVVTVRDGTWVGTYDEWCRRKQTPPPSAAAEPKTLPVPTRVYLTDKAAVIVGDPQCGWDEEGPDAHNCDAMGCASIGPHVLARVPFTDERAQQQPAAVDDSRCSRCTRLTPDEIIGGS